MEQEKQLGMEIKKRAISIMEQLSQEESGSPRYRELANELKTLSNLLKAEADYNSNELEDQRIEMENAKNTVDIQMHEADEKRKTWVTLVCALVPALIGGGLGLLGMKFEIFNNISGKVTMQAIKNVMNGIV